MEYVEWVRIRKSGHLKRTGSRFPGIAFAVGNNSLSRPPWRKSEEKGMDSREKLLDNSPIVARVSLPARLALRQLGLSVEFGRTVRSVGEVVKTSKGNVIELDRRECRHSRH